jgi:TetR/AcrR family transcriptional repressor of nem operon
VARPRQFDEETALDAALELFWQKGYAATSVDDLLTAMSLNRWSLYNTFGDKEALFLKALERYVQRWRGEIAQLVAAEPSPRARARRLLDALFTQVRSDSRAWGCLIVNSAFEFVQIPASAQAIVKRSLASLERLFADAIAQAGGRRAARRSRPARGGADAAGRAQRRPRRLEAAAEQSRRRQRPRSLGVLHLVFF